jgi:hypothetical protein
MYKNTFAILLAVSISKVGRSISLIRTHIVDARGGHGNKAKAERNAPLNQSAGGSSNHVQGRHRGEVENEYKVPGIAPDRVELAWIDRSHILSISIIACESRLSYLHP